MKDYLERLYVKALGRPSEPEGKEYWCKEMVTGWCTPVQAAKQFILSPKFEQKGLSNADFIRVLYETFLDREEDEIGFVYWQQKMNNGETRSEILEEFAQSQEFGNIVSSFGL